VRAALALLEERTAMTTIASQVAVTKAAGREATAGEREVVGGVDTHKDSHTAAVIDTAGRLLGSRSFAATGAGYAALVAWLAAFGRVVLIGVEGTGVYGAGLAEHCQRAGIALVEVDRPDRKSRRFAGKSDPLDAEAAARAALAGVRTGQPKQRGGPVDALRTLRVARRSAMHQRGEVMRQLKALVVTAPEQLRAQLRVLPDAALIRTCAALRPATGDPLAVAVADPAVAAKVSLRALARRWQQLTDELADLDALITPLVAALNPDLLARYGIGPDTAGQLLVTAGDNPDRLHSETAAAALTGTCPVPASSGRTTRHRLNRGGDRHANAAIHRIVLCRMRWDSRTRAYVTRRTTEGLTKKEIIRCLKRYLIREIYPDLLRTPA
jgi:transposase